MTQTELWKMFQRAKTKVRKRNFKKNDFALFFKGIEIKRSRKR